ncbi:uncharacterized protein LOC110256296 isoform X3 [Sus scrofa]|uniref:uncharacterized protein LOC110256296 isoform X3 n=1 Tax=Sus scrofa TaxID=9823 RepID=UPI000A2AF7A4|nr:uncharacterized protein LOC110256296 isoform X3 [Sus scrofa]
MRGWRRWSWSQSSPPIGTWSPVSAERPWLGLGQTSAARVVTPGELWALPWGALRPGQDPWAQPRRGAAGAEECPTVLPPACPGATGPRVRLAAAASCTEDQTVWNNPTKQAPCPLAPVQACWPGTLSRIAQEPWWCKGKDRAVEQYRCWTKAAAAIMHMIRNNLDPACCGPGKKIFPILRRQQLRWELCIWGSLKM